MTRNQISTFRGIRGVQHSQRREQQGDKDGDVFHGLFAFTSSSTASKAW